ncbi:hypothetical protein Droror1_Dr00005403 [Drosera rotundifolia]
MEVPREGEGDLSKALAIGMMRKKCEHMTQLKDMSSSSPTSARIKIIDEEYSLGKSLRSDQIKELASKGEQSYAVNVILTVADVVVEGFCMSYFGSHASSKAGSSSSKRFAYIWVRNSETQCPGQCAWPFHQPIYGPQSPPLVAPNGDVGMDGLVINLAGLLADTATNPFGNGFFQGPKEAPFEAASACPGIYGPGSEYLLPALFDLATSSCSTLV